MSRDALITKLEEAREGSRRKRVSLNRVLRIIADRSWARVRSPGRAARRLKRGFRQNIDVVWKADPNVLMTADMIIGHPATLQKLAEKVQTQ